MEVQEGKIIRLDILLSNLHHPPAALQVFGLAGLPRLIIQNQVIFPPLFRLVRGEIKSALPFNQDRKVPNFFLNIRQIHRQVEKVWKCHIWKSEADVQFRHS